MEWGLDELAQALIAKPAVKGRCPHCLTKAEEVRKTGWVGCPLCYTVLSDEIERLIQEARQGTEFG